MAPEVRPLALLVEVDGDLADSVSGMLDMLGYDVRISATTNDALYTVAEDPVALVILEVGLPNSASLQFLRLVRRNSSTVDLPVLLTGAVYAKDREIKQFKALGAALFLGKPFTIRLLRDALRRVHPEGPIEGQSILGTSHWGLTPVEEPEEPEEPEELQDAISTQSMDAWISQSRLPVGPPAPAPTPPTTWTLRVVATGHGLKAELDRVAGDELHVRTVGRRLVKGEVVEVRIDVTAAMSRTLRFHGEVVRTSWRLGGGSSRILVRAAVPTDALAQAAALL